MSIPHTAADPRAALNRGAALRRAGRAREALSWLLQAVELAPESAEVWLEVGWALLDAGDTAESERATRRAVACAPDMAIAWVALGRVLAVRGVRDAPAACWRRALDLEPDNVEAHVRLGTQLAASGAHDEAGRHLGAALRLAPNDAGAVAGAATLLELGGDPAAAWRLLRSHRGNDPRVALASATAGRRTGHTHLALERIDRALPVSPPQTRAQLLYARGDLLDALDRPAEAWKAWSDANAGRGLTFDPDAHARAVDDLIARTTGRDWPPGPAAGAERCVFVVGMPRTGSTLLEQALSRHPDIAGCGELEAIRDIAVAIPRPGEAYWACALDRLGEAELATLRDAYLAHVDGMAGGRSRVIDKMPNNLLHLGLIAAILPGATVIRCARDPMDTAFSCFRQAFGPGLAWATDLRWIAAWMFQAERLLDHWQTTLPLRFHTVRYEELATTPEPTLRGVLEHLRLPFDPDVLRPEGSARPVATASALEVQAPIHGRSVGRAARYARWLGSWPSGERGLTCPR